MNQATPSADRHSEIWDLLPWYANSTLSDADQRTVEAHLESCTECARELSFLSGLSATMHAEEALLVPAERSLAAVTGRIDTVEAARQGRLDWRDVARIVRAKLAAGGGFRLDPALAAIALLLIVVTAWFGSSAFEPEFRTLSNVEAQASDAEPTIRLVFAGTATIDELQELLTGLGVTLVQGPSNYGVYTARIAAAPNGAQPVEVLDELRRHPLVSFAEPIPGPEAPGSAP